MTTPEPVRLYRGGPIRLFSTERFLGGTPFVSGAWRGYVGYFVCSQCRGECHRVLFVQSAGDWLCRDCETAAKRERAGHMVGKGTK
jgi:hypothetical protein